MPETITDHDARYAIDLVDTICTEVGPGLPGSSQERARAAIIQRELEAQLGAENVVVEEFTLAPGAFLGSLPLSALFMLLAAVLNISVWRFPEISPGITALAALVFSSLALLLVVFEFFFSHEFVDRFFPQKQSINVIGTLRKPGTTTVKRVLILSGHHDSALENVWIYFLGYGFIVFSIIWLIGYITMFALSVIQLTGTVTGNAAIIHSGTLGWGLLLFSITPAAIYALFCNRGRKNGGVVPGAVDNLSASALVVALCRFLVKNPAYLPDDMEIRFISFGSEEAGLRGSRRYVARHLDELKRLDARLLNFEMIAHPEITILTSDMSGTVKNSPEMVRSVVAAADRAEVPYQVKPATFGVANDSAPFSRVGLKAMTLLPFKSPQQMVAFYHQRRDTPEVLTREPLFNTLKLAVEWVRCGGE